MAGKKRTKSSTKSSGQRAKGKKNAPRQKQSTNTNKDKKVISTRIGVTLLITGFLMLLSMLGSFISAISMGSFGEFSFKMLTSLFGVGAYIIPFLVISMGYMYIISKGKVTYSSRFYGIIIILISILVFLNILRFKTFYDPADLSTAIEKINESTTVIHGGVMTFLVTIPLCSIFGTTGSIFIVFSGFIIGGIFIAEMEFHQVLNMIKGYLGMKVNERRLRKKDEVMPQNLQKKPENKAERMKRAEVAVADNRNSFEKEDSRIKIVDFLKSNTIPEEQKAHEPKGEESKQMVEELNKAMEQKSERVDEPIIRESVKTSTPAPVRTESKPREVERKGKLNPQEKEEIKESIGQEIQCGESVNEKEIREYIFPQVDLLKENTQEQSSSDRKELLQHAAKLTNTLKSFGVKAKVTEVTRGPSVTRFEIQPEIGVKVSKIVNLSDDIALNLAAPSIRIEAPIPGKAAVGIEVPNKKLVPVLFREIIESRAFAESGGKLTTGLGKDISGEPLTADLSKMPHVLVAGATGSGKSVCINCLIISILYKYAPEDVKLLMIDPKVVELNVYNGIPHLLIPVVTDPRKAAGALGWAVGEMERRYKAFADNGAKNIDSYNELYERGIIEEKMPYIVIVIDELADLMMVSPKDVEGYIARLAQMARAAGMHLVIATQRPSVDVITGMIKANIPSRIAFAVSSQVDSRTIIDGSGAEKLLGKGDMLFLPIGASKPTRIQGAFISESEVEEIVNFIKVDKGQDPKKDRYEVDIIDAIDNNADSGENNKDGADPLLNEVIEYVIKQRKASTSMVQRRFKIGYNRAARIIEEMEERGVVSGPNGSKPRQILVEAIEEM